MEPLYARLEAQAERIGHLEEQSEPARVRVAELEMVPVVADRAETHNGGAPWQERGRWWQRLVWG